MLTQTLADDTFAAEEDTQLSGSVFSDNGNGADDLGDAPATVTSFDSMSANGGTVVVNPDGTFTYDPAARLQRHGHLHLHGDRCRWRYRHCDRDGRCECRARPCYRRQCPLRKTRPSLHRCVDQRRHRRWPCNRNGCALVTSPPTAALL